MTTIYVAGPMFSDADRWQQNQITDALEAEGFETFLAPRDGIEVAKAIDILTGESDICEEDRKWIVDLACKAGFALDVFQIVERCQACVFNMDGRVPDEGGVSESAIAYATGKPVILFRTSPLSLMGGIHNPMVHGLGNWRFVSRVEDLGDALADIRPRRISPVWLNSTINFGRKVWESIDLIHDITERGDAKEIIGAATMLEEAWQEDVDLIWPHQLVEKYERNRRLERI